MYHFFAEHRAHQDRLGNPAVGRLKLRQHAEPGIDVARRAGEARDDHPAVEILLDKLFGHAMNVAGDLIVRLTHRGAVGGIGENHGDQVACSRLRHLQYLHFLVGRPIGVPAEFDLGLAVLAGYGFAPVDADRRRAGPDPDLSRNHVRQRPLTSSTS